MMIDSVIDKQNKKIVDENYHRGTREDCLYCVKLMIQNYFLRFFPVKYRDNLAKILTDSETRKIVSEFEKELSDSPFWYSDSEIISKRDITSMYNETCRPRKIMKNYSQMSFEK